MFMNDDSGYKFEIGNIVRHKMNCEVRNPDGSIDYHHPRGFILERKTQERLAGVQRYYLCRIFLVGYEKTPMWLYEDELES